MENIPLATEIIRTMKKIIFALIILEVLTIAGFMWYISLPTDETYIEQESDNDSYNQIIGGDYNGEQTKSNSQEKSNQK